MKAAKKDYSKIAIVAVAIAALFIGLLIILSQQVRQPEQQAPKDESPFPTYKPPSGTPSIKIVFPKDGETIQVAAVGIRVNVTNFRLADIAANQPNRHNEGHIDYFLDDREQKTPFVTTSYINVPPGVHVVRVELRNNDDTPLDPPVLDLVQITTTGRV